MTKSCNEIGLRRLAAVVLAAVAVSLTLAPSASAMKVTFKKRVLTVEGTGAKDRISVYCGANSKVKMNGRNPRGGPIACSRVVEVDVIAGRGDDRIRMDGVGREFGEARFTGFGVGTGVAVVGGDDDDELIGSARAFNFYLAGEGEDAGSGGRRRDILSGGIGDDKLEGFGARDTLLGKEGADTLNGGRGNDLLSGNAGNDRLFGRAGADLLGGGPGDDRLRGGRGPDRLVGGAGEDDLDGGPGRDEEFQEKPPEKISRALSAARAGPSSNLRP